MRARRQPGCAARAARTARTSGARAAAGGSRSLRRAASQAARASASGKAGGSGRGGLSRRTRRGEDRGRRHRDAGVGEHQPEGRQGEGVELLADAAHAAGLPAMQTGTSAPRAARAAAGGSGTVPEAGEQAQRRGGVGRAAADAAGDGERLGQAEGGAGGRRSAAEKVARRGGRGCRCRRRGRGRRGRRWRATDPRLVPPPARSPTRGKTTRLSSR